MKSFIKYALSFALALVLFWYVFKDQNIDQIYQDLKDANYTWVFLSFVVAILAHLSRAYRWNLLLESVGNKPSLFNSFLAVMVGYVANIVLPRMGEVSRCAVLQKTDKIPFTTSFGSVVAERLFDLISLISILTFTLILESGRLSGFVTELFAEKFKIDTAKIFMLLGVLGILTVLAVMTIRYYKENIKKLSFYSKMRDFSKGLMDGLMSVRRLKNFPAFLFHTVIIWTCYYLMSYLIFFSIPSTSHLGLTAGMTVLVMGGLGMAAPVQGGIGAYHWIISNTLLLYGLTLSEGLKFATLVHTSQLIMIAVVGLISLTIVLMKTRGKKISVQPVHENI